MQVAQWGEEAAGTQGRVQWSGHKGAGTQEITSVVYL